MLYRSKSDGFMKKTRKRKTTAASLPAVRTFRNLSVIRSFFPSSSTDAADKLKPNISRSDGSFGKTKDGVNKQGSSLPDLRVIFRGIGDFTSKDDPKTGDSFPVKVQTDAQIFCAFVSKELREEPVVNEDYDPEEGTSVDILARDTQPAPEEEKPKDRPVTVKQCTSNPPSKELREEPVVNEDYDPEEGTSVDILARDTQPAPEEEKPKDRPVTVKQCTSNPPSKELREEPVVNEDYDPEEGTSVDILARDTQPAPEEEKPKDRPVTVKQCTSYSLAPLLFGIAVGVSVAFVC